MDDLKYLTQLQLQLAQQVIIPQDNFGYCPQSHDLIFSLDIQYVQNLALVGLDIQRYDGEWLGTYVEQTVVIMEYIPQFFCFREGPPLLQVINKIQQDTNLTPSLLITDGHGIAHPRRFGIACWLGVQTQLPVIGCAKQTLLPYSGELGNARGSWLPVCLREEVVGKVLRTQTGVKPIFVSPGHQISLTMATQLILELTPTYRLCEPLRRADQAAREYARRVQNQTLA